jgi:hypothetical protein
MLGRVVQQVAALAARRRRCGRGVLIATATLLLAGCANGDFGRVKPNLVRDYIHDWVGVAAIESIGAPASQFPLTDEERLLRDLAYPLIEPPYDRQRWYSILNEYGLLRSFHGDWCYVAPETYFQHLVFKRARSPASRYATLNDDVRNDIDRIPTFFDTARRVLDTDKKREKSLQYIRGLSEAERANAAARNAENGLIVAWVQRTLAGRADSYRFALERLVVSVPSAQAVEVERSLTLMQQRIAANHVVEPPAIAVLPPGVRKMQARAVAAARYAPPE